MNPNPNPSQLPRSPNHLRRRRHAPAISDGPRPRRWSHLKWSTTPLLSIRFDLEDTASPARARPLLSLGLAVASAVLAGSAPLDVLVLPDDHAGGGVWAGTNLVAVWRRRDWLVPPCRHGCLQASPGTPLLPLSALLTPSSPLGSSYWWFHLLRCCCLLAMTCYVVLCSSYAYCCYARCSVMLNYWLLLAYLCLLMLLYWIICSFDSCY
jgi:hypothetical protein